MRNTACRGAAISVIQSGITYPSSINFTEAHPLLVRVNGIRVEQSTLACPAKEFGGEIAVGSKGLQPAAGLNSGVVVYNRYAEAPPLNPRSL